MPLGEGRQALAVKSAVCLDAHAMHNPSAAADKDREEAEWLAAIARDRDREAFAAVFTRYEALAYRMALHITGQPAEAEEAVQESMLRIWKGASQFRGEGTVQNWVLRIVARESLQRLRRQKRGHDMVELDEAGGALAGKEPEGTKREQEEMLAVLRKALEELPLKSRQVVALYFGGGLSQAEVGKALSLSQPVVSRRIEEALARLRNTLSVAGFTSVSAGLSAELWTQALHAGTEVPAGLASRVMARIASASQSMRRLSRRSPPSPASKLAMPLAAGAILVLGGALIWSLSGKREAPQERAKAAAPVPAPERNRSGFANRTWIFDRPAPKELEVLHGAWTWNAGAKTMDIPKVIDVRLPVIVDELPLKVTVRSRFHDLRKKMRFAIGLIEGATFVPTSRCYHAHHDNLRHKDFVHETYLFERYLVQNDRGQPVRFLEHTRPLLGCGLLMEVENLDIESIEVHRIEPGELPDFLRDEQTLLEQLTPGNLVPPGSPIPVRKQAGR